MVRLTVLAVVATFVAGAPEAAPSPRTDYEVAFRRANAYTDDHEWAKAREQYQIAYGIEPRPILLFNIGSTYYFEGDRTNARVYYRWYLDKAGPDATYAGEARERIAELQRSDATVTHPATVVVPPPPPSRAPYPTDAIARPMTLSARTIEVTAGSALVAYDASSMSTDRTVRGLVTAAYAITDRWQATAGGVIDAEFARDSYGAGELTYAFGAALAARAELTIGAASDVFVAIPYRFRLGSRFAIAATATNAFQVRLDGDHRIMLGLPAGIGVQLTPSVYATIETALVRYDSPALASSRLRAFIADYGDVTGTLTLVPRDDLDVVLEAAAFTSGFEALGMLRLRL